MGRSGGHTCQARGEARQMTILPVVFHGLRASGLRRHPSADVDLHGLTGRPRREAGRAWPRSSLLIRQTQPRGGSFRWDEDPAVRSRYERCWPGEGRAHALHAHGEAQGRLSGSRRIVAGCIRRAHLTLTGLSRRWGGFQPREAISCVIRRHSVRVRGGDVASGARARAVPDDGGGKTDTPTKKSPQCLNFSFFGAPSAPIPRHATHTSRTVMGGARKGPVARIIRNLPTRLVAGCPSSAGRRGEGCPPHIGSGNRVSARAS